MGEILKSTYAIKPEQLTQLQAGLISILTGYNLRKPAKPISSDENTKPHPPNLALRGSVNYGDQVAKGGHLFLHDQLFLGCFELVQGLFQGAVALFQMLEIQEADIAQ